MQILWGRIPEDMEEGGGSPGLSAMEEVQGGANESDIGGRKMGGG